MTRGRRAGQPIGGGRDMVTDGGRGREISRNVVGENETSDGTVEKKKTAIGRTRETNGAKKKPFADGEIKTTNINVAATDCGDGNGGGGIEHGTADDTILTGTPRAQRSGNAACPTRLRRASLPPLTIDDTVYRTRPPTLLRWWGSARDGSAVGGFAGRLY